MLISITKYVNVKHSPAHRLMKPQHNRVTKTRPTVPRTHAMPMRQMTGQTGWAQQRAVREARRTAVGGQAAWGTVVAGRAARRRGVAGQVARWTVVAGQAAPCMVGWVA